jgi:hypothetical protein
VRDAMRDVQRAYFCPPLELERSGEPRFLPRVGDNTLWRRRAFGFWLVPAKSKPLIFRSGARRTPPRIPTLGEISRFFANSPELAGLLE